MAVVGGNQVLPTPSHASKRSYASCIWDLEMGRWCGEPPASYLHRMPLPGLVGARRFESPSASWGEKSLTG